MASGWTYLLSDSGSDDGSDGPVTLPDGRLACYTHLNITCHKCCVDYSFGFTKSSSDDEEEEDDGIVAAQQGGQDSQRSQNPDVQCSDLMVEIPVPNLSSREMRRGTGRIFPTKFTVSSPTSTPSRIFQGRATYANLTRFIHRKDPQKFLIFTGGACINNGQPSPQAGWAFVQGPRAQGDPVDSPARTVAGRLENKGPFGDEGGQTSNRAEMRAVIAALRFCHWPGEGFKVMVIATDSEYVMDGATTWAKGWVRNGWRTRTGEAVENKDLWECLLGEVERFRDLGMKVGFWRISRDLNTVADAAAKAAAEEVGRDDFMDVKGLCI